MSDPTELAEDPTTRAPDPAPLTADELLRLHGARATDAALAAVLAGGPPTVISVLLLDGAAASSLLAELPRLFGCADLPPPFGSGPPLDGERSAQRLACHAFAVFLARRRLDGGGALAMAVTPDFATYVVRLFRADDVEAHRFREFSPPPDHCTLVVVDGSLRLSWGVFAVGAAFVAAARAEVSRAVDAAPRLIVVADGRATGVPKGAARGLRR